MSSELHYLCRVDELSEDVITAGLLPDGHRVAIYLLEDEVFVTDDRCTHGDASLTEEGSIEGCQVECSWHFGRFDIRTGEPAAGPCTEPIRTYRVSVISGDVFVSMGDAMRIASTPVSCRTEEG
ncbi:MAG: non-heme iron oxygenase ferredoxin subunit [Ramlibacter sp.]